MGRDSSRDASRVSSMFFFFPFFNLILLFRLQLGRPLVRPLSPKCPTTRLEGPRRVDCHITTRHDKATRTELDGCHDDNWQHHLAWKCEFFFKWFFVLSNEYFIDIYTYEQRRRAAGREEMDRSWQCLLVHGKFFFFFFFFHFFLYLSLTQLMAHRPLLTLNFFLALVPAWLRRAEGSRPACPELLNVHFFYV